MLRGSLGGDIFILLQTQEVPEQHEDRHLPDRRDVQGGLVPDVVFEVFVCGNIQAEAAVLKPSSLNFICWTWYCRNDNIRESETFLKRQGARVDDMAWVVLARLL